MGPLTYTEETGEVFLGRSVTQHKQVSDGTAHAIDEEIRNVIETNYQWAKQILVTHLDRLHAMAEALIKYETIDDGQLKDIMDGKAAAAARRLGRVTADQQAVGPEARRPTRTDRLARGQH